MRETAIILLGSNLGDREKNLETALIKLLEITGNGEINLSGIYETAAWGNENQPAFLNQAIGIKTAFSPEELLEIMLEIEKNMGRARDIKWNSRTIDMDLLYHGMDIRKSKNLDLPHPFIAVRKFVLVPVNEIYPEFIHPVTGNTQHQLLEMCTDPLPVKLIRNKG